MTVSDVANVPRVGIICEILVGTASFNQSIGAGCSPWSTYKADEIHTSGRLGPNVKTLSYSVRKLYSCDG